MSSPSTPASSKTTGRMGASRRQSASFWSLLRGGRSVSGVAAHVGSAPVRRSSAGKVQVTFPVGTPRPPPLPSSRNPCALKGGTALRFQAGLSRPSTDLDFEGDQRISVGSTIAPRSERTEILSARRPRNGG